MRIYVASSWRNPIQPAVVGALREAGHDVFDFRHPAPGNDGFRWSSINPDYRRQGGDAQMAMLQHPIAVAAYNLDMGALEGAGAVVLVLPCGKSSHLEAGYAAGRGIPVHVLGLPEEPELMYRMMHVHGDLDTLTAALADRRCGPCRSF